jgi:hypothetical protein
MLAQLLHRNTALDRDTAGFTYKIEALEVLRLPLQCQFKPRRRLRLRILDKTSA